MPLPLLNAYIRMMPRLQAEEMLQDVTTAAVGSGALKASESRRIMGQLRRQAGAGSGIVQVKKPSDIGAMLATVGITKS